MIPWKCAYPSLLNNPVESADNLLHWNGRVSAVSKDDIDVVHLQTFQSFLCALNNAVRSISDIYRVRRDGIKGLLLPREAAIVGTLTETPEELGGDDQVSATVVKLLQDTAAESASASVNRMMRT